MEFIWDENKAIINQANMAFLLLKRPRSSMILMPCSWEIPIIQKKKNASFHLAWA